MAGTDSYKGIIDPSLLLRPERIYEGVKAVQFRDESTVKETAVKERVRKLYYEKHTNMTVDFVNAKIEKWLKFDTFRQTVTEVLFRMNDLIDESYPRQKVTLLTRAFQTAEAIRKDYPEEKWFQLVGLLHNLGKVMTFYGEPEWVVAGDTFPVGVKWGKSIVYGEDSFKNNPDAKNPKFNSEYGIYRKNCGVENLLMSWSASEYLYRVMENNKPRHFPKEGLYMIRYQNFYPFFASGDYKQLLREGDDKIRDAVLRFNKYYQSSKSTPLPDIDTIWPYYEQLISEYVPWYWNW